MSTETDHQTDVFQSPDESQQETFINVEDSPEESQQESLLNNESEELEDDLNESKSKFDPISFYKNLDPKVKIRLGSIGAAFFGLFFFLIAFFVPAYEWNESKNKYQASWSGVSYVRESGESSKSGVFTTILLGIVALLSSGIIAFILIRTHQSGGKDLDSRNHGIFLKASGAFIFSCLVLLLLSFHHLAVIKGIQRHSDHYSRHSKITKHDHETYCSFSGGFYLTFLSMFLVIGSSAIYQFYFEVLDKDLESVTDTESDSDSDSDSESSEDQEDRTEVDDSVA